MMLTSLLIKCAFEYARAASCNSLVVVSIECLYSSYLRVRIILFL